MEARNLVTALATKLILLCGMPIFSNDAIAALGEWPMRGWVDSANITKDNITLKLKWGDIYECVLADLNGSQSRYADLDIAYDFSQELNFEIRRKRNEGLSSILPADFFDDAELIGTTTKMECIDESFGKVEGFEPVLYQVKGIGKCKGFLSGRTWTVTAVITARRRVCFAYGLTDLINDPTVWGTETPAVDVHLHPGSEAGKVCSIFGGGLAPRVRNLCSKKVLIDDFKNISEQYERGAPYAKPGDIVFFYLSSHGSPDRVTLYDGHLYKEELADCVREFKGKGVRFIGIINACHSGALIEQFKSDEFNYTAWIASCRGTEGSTCFSTWSGFERTFLDWGLNQGLGKLDSVVTFKGERVSTGAKPDGYLNLFEAAHYADLLFPGGSSVSEQHFAYVREDVLKKIAVKKVGSTPQGTIPARPSKPKLSTNEQDSTLKIELDSYPQSGIYLVSDYGLIWPMWGLNAKTFLSRGQFVVVNSQKDISDWMYPFIADRSMPYEFYCRVLGTGGWSERSESVPWTSPSSIQWFNDLVRSGKMAAVLNNPNGANVPEIWDVTSDSVQVSIETLPIDEDDDINPWKRGNYDVSVSVEIKRNDEVLCSAKAYAPIKDNDDLCSFSVRIPADSFRVYDYDMICQDLEFDVGPNRIEGVWGDESIIGMPSVQYEDDENPYESYFEPLSYLLKRQANKLQEDGCRISYIMNGGINSLANPYSFTTNDLPIELKAPRRTGYDFKGWSPNGGRIEEGTRTNCTFTAMWEQTMLTILLDANDGATPVQKIVMRYGEKFGDRLPTLRRNGFLFLGWYAEGATPWYDAPITVDSKAFASGSIHAEWYKVGGDLDGEFDFEMCVVTFDAYGGFVFPTNRVVVSGSAIGALPTPTREGSSFDGWFTAATGGSKITESTKVSSDVTYYAHWIKNGGGGTPTPGPKPGKTPGEYGEMALCDSVVGAVPLAAASEYGGYLYDGSGNVAGTIQVKVGKANAKTGLAAVKATVVGLDGKKKSLKAAEKGKATISEDGPTTIKLVGGELCEVTLGAEGLSGTYGAYRVDGVRNFFTSKDKGEHNTANGLLASWLGPVNVVWDDGNASVAIGKKGKVKVYVTLANGTKSMVNTQLLIGEEWLCVPVVVTKKMNLAFTLWLPRNGGAAVVEGLPGDAVVGKAGALKAGAKFRIDAEEFSARWGQRALPYLPDGVAVTANGTRWTLPKAGKVQMSKDGTVDAAKLGGNPAALKLTYKAKDGSFKGSFKAYSLVNGKPKAVTVNVAGVVVGGVGYGTATIKGKGSVAVLLLAADERK